MHTRTMFSYVQQIFLYISLVFLLFLDRGQCQVKIACKFSFKCTYIPLKTKQPLPGTSTSRIPTTNEMRAPASGQATVRINAIANVTMPVLPDDNETVQTRVVLPSTSPVTTPNARTLSGTGGNQAQIADTTQAGSHGLQYLTVKTIVITVASLASALCVALVLVVIFLKRRNKALQMALTERGNYDVSLQVDPSADRYARLSPNRESELVDPEYDDVRNFSRI